MVMKFKIPLLSWETRLQCLQSVCVNLQQNVSGLTRLYVCTCRRWTLHIIRVWFNSNNIKYLLVSLKSSGSF